MKLEVSPEAKKHLAEYGTKDSGFAGGGPFSCMDCIHRTPHTALSETEVVDTCSHPDVMDDVELQDRKMPDGTIRIFYGECCGYVRPVNWKKDFDLPEDVKERGLLARHAKRQNA